MNHFSKSYSIKDIRIIPVNSRNKFTHIIHYTYSHSYTQTYIISKPPSSYENNSCIILDFQFSPNMLFCDIFFLSVKTRFLCHNKNIVLIEEMQHVTITNFWIKISNNMNFGTGSKLRGVVCEYVCILIQS